MLLLTFQLGHARFGIQATVVHEVVRAVEIAALPKAPPIVEGVINYRGRVAPILDVRARFDLTPTLLHPDEHFIIAQAGARVVGLRVDRASELVDVPPEDIEPARSSTPGVQYTAGIARLPDGLIVIHDLETFLSADEAWTLDAAMESSG